MKFWKKAEPVKVEPVAIMVPLETWHLLTHSVFLLAEAVRGVQATLKRMETNMSEQGDALTTVVDKLLTNVAAVDAEVKDLQAKVAAGQVADPQIAAQIARLGSANDTLQGDLPQVAPAAAAAVAGSDAGTAGTTAA